MQMYHEDFIKLVKLLSNEPHPKIHVALCAQWMLESARGNSGLARLHNNFAGMKWRPELKDIAKKVKFDAPSETAYFCSFQNLKDFLAGYWIFLNRSPYAGWEETTGDPYEFVAHIGKKWAADPIYIDKVQDLFAEAETLIDGADDNEEVPCCDGMAGESTNSIFDLTLASISKPAVKFVPSPYFWSRGGTDIDKIVMHYTTSRNFNGTIDWFKSPNNKRKTAAHYVISRDGDIVQMVEDKYKCIHGNNENSRSIGIEHSAAQGDAMTSKQSVASANLVRWLMLEYDVKIEDVIPHKCASGSSTRCPGELFGKHGDNDGCSAHQKAVTEWVKNTVL